MQQPYSPMSAAELYNADFSGALMLVKPFMPQGGQCMLHGKRGLGKTQLAHTLAVDIALGQPFLGKYEVVQESVFYVQADMTPQLQQDRLRRIIDAGVPAGLPLRYKVFAGGFDCEAELAEAAPWIDDLRAFDPGLVVIDTLRKSHRLEENDSDSVIRVYTTWRDICGPRATILYLHHDRKTGDMPRDNKDEEFRGSGAWLDEADLGMHLCKGKTGMYLDWSKLRTCAESDVLQHSLVISPDSLLIQADDPVANYMMTACAEGVPKATIVAMVINRDRFGDKALTRSVAYNRLDGYEPVAAKI